MRMCATQLGNPYHHHSYYLVLKDARLGLFVNKLDYHKTNFAGLLTNSI